MTGPGSAPRRVRPAWSASASTLVDVERFRRVLERRPGIVDRLFTEGERADAGRQRDPAQRLAARFAAKEAVMKALGTGVGAFACATWRWCGPTDRGAPGGPVAAGAAPARPSWPTAAGWTGGTSR